jgi:hypothetical protein
MNKRDITQVVFAKISAGGAIAEGIKPGYPSYFNRRIPLKVRMNTTVESDAPFPICLDYKPCLWSHEYYVQVNSYGAVTAIHEDGSLLGLKPGEFKIIEWHD